MKTDWPAVNFLVLFCIKYEIYLINFDSTHHSGFSNIWPRVIVRSIKPIQKDEEVCITYIDLLEPKVLSAGTCWLETIEVSNLTLLYCLLVSIYFPKRERILVLVLVS